MELSEDIIKKLELKEEAAKEINDFVRSKFEDTIATEKKTIEEQYKSKALENAEAILDSAAESVIKVTDIKRNKGERIADYHRRVSLEMADSFSKKEADLNKLRQEIEGKIKDGSGSEVLTKRLEKLEADYSELQKKEAAFDELIGSGVKESYDSLLSEHTTLKQNLAFNEVKPKFPEAANPYEVKAKWDNFKNNVLKDYDVKIIDNEPIAISKENQHKQVKLAELVAKDTDLTELQKVRSQNGFASKPILNSIEIEGVPIPISSDRSKFHQDLEKYLVEKEGLPVLSDAFSKRFSEINTASLKTATQKTVAA